MISQVTPETRSRQAVKDALVSRVVPKPTPESQRRDARGYQMEQIRKRFSSRESQVGDETSFLFKMAPSDPDFPFELDYLQCDLRVPAAYPQKSPRMLIKNTNVPRGHCINIERGWDDLVQERHEWTLLSLMHALDRNLESLLSEQAANTVKLVTFHEVKDTRHLKGVVSSPEELPVRSRSTLSPPVAEPEPYAPDDSYSREQIVQARTRRAQEVMQLEARMSRLPMYQRSGDGVVYTLSVEPRRRSALPTGLQAVKAVQLIVPLLYPLQPPRVLLNDVESREAEAVEELFCKRAVEKKQMTITSHMNYLSSNIHLLAKEVKEAQEAQEASAKASFEKLNNNQAETAEAGHTAQPTRDKGHVQVIPRPPEWASGGGSNGSGLSNLDSASDSASDSDLDDSGSGGDAASMPGKAGPLITAGRISETGTAMTFPSIELYGIELLKVSLLSLSIKCERCKTFNDMAGLKSNIEKKGSCKKCATAFSVKYRQKLVHQNSTRAGFIDVSGCMIGDLLPSTFTPTCAVCSTPSFQGIVSVRGESTTNVCRECHSRWTFKIPDVKFLLYAPGINRLPPISASRRRQEKLGLHAGEPLPDKGTCAHYKRSYRWFRFSCCAKVYACDRCHDGEADHDNEWANRMICGWCSREQNYAVESCAFCGLSVIGKHGKGFWEGGKGTRNKTLMRRGDRRKYKRVGGGEARKREREN